MTKDSKPNRALSDTAFAPSARHRQLLVFSGSREWAQQQAQQFITQSAVSESHVLWLGTADSQTGYTSLPAQAASRVLGHEFSLIVFNVFDGFDADAFGMVSGTLLGGGKLLLLCPPLEEWPTYHDPASEKLIPFGSESIQHSRFLQRIVQILQNDTDTQVFEEALPSPPSHSTFPRKRESILSAIKMDSRPAHAPCRAGMTTIPGGLLRGNDEEEPPTTPNQSHAIKAITHAAKSRARRPVVLTADRGRGKSTALGLAAAELLQQDFTGNGDIIITAPRPAACEQAFIHAARILPQASLQSNRLTYNNKTLRYVAPDVLAHDQVLHKNPPRLVMVDEAAAIPTPLLTRILQHFPRTVFATTIHGYEGTGRGFALRFRHTLNTLTPDWKAITLKAPIRWAENDPLETITAKLLLLDAEAADDEQIAGAAADNYDISRVDRDGLICQPFAAHRAAPTNKHPVIPAPTSVIPALRQSAGQAPAGIQFQKLGSRRSLSRALSRGGNDAHLEKSILNDLFGLLVLAHYRTRPFDLRLLLDAPNIRIYCAFYKKHVAAVALVAMEGGLDAEIAQAICYGQRRPQGHLLPETLAAQAGFADAAILKAARILRIAVHPAVQGRGLGSAMLQHIHSDLKSDVDYLGSVFGATPGLLKFWQQAGFTPAWMGTTRGKSTGEHAALVMQPTSHAGRELQTFIKKQFTDNLPQQLADPHSLADLESALVCALLQSSAALSAPTKNDWQAIETFAHGNRPFESVLTPVWRLALWALSEPTRCKSLSEQQITALLTRVIQRQTWQQVARACDVAGKPQLIELLREACAQMFEMAD